MSRESNGFYYLVGGDVVETLTIEEPVQANGRFPDAPEWIVHLNRFHRGGMRLHIVATSVELEMIGRQFLDLAARIAARAADGES